MNSPRVKWVELQDDGRAGERSTGPNHLQWMSGVKISNYSIFSSGSCSIPNLEAMQLRANPDLEVVPLRLLTHSQLEMVASTTDVTQIYGVFHSRSTGCVISAIDHDTAILFSTLSGSGQLTEFLNRRLGSNRDRILARLVYDGVLQIRSPDGCYVDGSAAHSLLGGPRASPQPLTTLHPIVRMSRDAVAHCALINFVDTLALSQRLYLYNRHPELCVFQRVSWIVRRCSAGWVYSNDGVGAASCGAAMSNSEQILRLTLGSVGVCAVCRQLCTRVTRSM